MLKLKKIILALAVSNFPFAQADVEQTDLTAFSFDELMEIEVTSVSKRSEKLSEASAAVYVVTQNEIRRSGATTIPEALRLVPGVDAARIDNNKWSVAIRGFGDRFANKLLVLIDGRSVYTPTFSGVYWESLDYLMADIERIEVIRGPGATLWGANAVNGVINIITKDAASTQQGLASVAVGNELEHLIALRKGEELSDKLKARVYAQVRQVDSAESQSGQQQDNSGEYQQVGFRADWHPRSAHWITLQGDLYSNKIGQEHTAPGRVEQNFLDHPVSGEAETDGGNLVMLWNHLSGINSESALKVTYEHFDRTDFKFDDRRDTLDLDFKYQRKVLDNHEMVFGAGFRWSDSKLGIGELLIDVDEPEKDTRIWNLYFQDDISLMNEALRLTLGAKLEGNSEADTDFQPNIRLSWTPSEQMTWWGAISRAARTPSRGEHDISLLINTFPPFTLDPSNPLPSYLVVNGDEGYRSEFLNAYEAGLRWSPVQNLTIDFTAFYNDYSDLRNYAQQLPYIDQSDLVPVLIVPLTLTNTFEGWSKGLELMVDWHASDYSHFRFSYSRLNIELDAGPEDTRYTGDARQLVEDRAPDNQASLWASFDIGPDWELDLRLRYTGDRPWSPQTAGGIDSITNLDARVAWQVTPQLTLSVTGNNLLKDAEAEYVIESWPTISAIERSAHLKLDYLW